MAGQGSSSPSSSFAHNVFFYSSASDNRHGFGGNLLKALHDRGIRTFVDIKAIQHPRVAIIVFSKNDAASSLFLDVLAYILDYFQGNDQFILPVFYQVDPPDVRQQRGTYGEALARREETFKDNGERAQKRRTALFRVANLPGWHFKPGDGYELEFIGKIVEEVSRKLLFAVDSRLQEVYLHLELGSDGVLMLGMYGVAGSGIKTLARKVHDIIADQFQGSCFLDVGENRNKRGLVHLQSMLLSEIVGENYIDLGDASRGISIIKHRLHGKKVLLTLTGVETLEQLEALVGGPDWFGSGSRVIVTTWDRHMLAFHGVERRYEVQELNHRDALELHVDPSYTGFLNKLVASTFELPLGLTETGSNLFGKNVGECRYALYRSKRSPLNNVQKTSQSVPEVSQTSQSVPDVSHTSQRFPEVSQTSQRVASVVLQILQRVLQAKTTWRLVGLVSSVVGLSCNALSPSFNRLIGGRNSFKLLLYELLSLVICTIILFAKESSFFTQHVQLKAYMNFMILMIISMYSFFYDKAVDGKPEILSLVSNAAFSLMSLSLSKLIRFGFETGMFSYFIGCLAVQLFTINRMLILVAILYGCPLFYIHSSSDSRPEVDYRGQAIDSSLDSEPEVDSAQDIHSSNYAGQAIYSTSINQPDAGNGSQVFHSYSDFQPEVISGGQVIRCSSDSRPEVGSGVQHVVDIRT